MTNQKELQETLAKSVVRAIKKYQKAGGIEPRHAEDVFIYIDGNALGWSLTISDGHVDPAKIFLTDLGE